MKILADELQRDESKSNPMAVAMVYSGCPMPEKRPCFWIVVGFGTIAEQCPHFKPDAEKPEADCVYGGE